MVPSSARKAAVSGSSVFFIQKHCWAGSSKTNSMPSCCGISARNIRPIWRCSGCQGHLGVDLVHAGAQLDPRQVHLRLVLGQGQAAPGSHKERADAAMFSWFDCVAQKGKCPRRGHSGEGVEPLGRTYPGFRLLVGGLGVFLGLLGSGLSSWPWLSWRLFSSLALAWRRLSFLHLGWLQPWRPAFSLPSWRGCGSSCGAAAAAAAGRRRQLGSSGGRAAAAAAAAALAAGAAVWAKAPAANRPAIRVARILFIWNFLGYLDGLPSSLSGKPSVTGASLRWRLTVS